ncbi:MAG TPA: DUF3592 domain-containing protein [Polyangiaceae bacterium]|nr:DUF3592 domain-containing protein [Polyangiaceae bacterium]
MLVGREPLYPQKEGSPTVTIWLGALIWFPVLWLLISTYTLPVLSSLGTWNWQETSCTIRSARTQLSETTVRHSKVVTTRAVVKYGYDVAGREYVSERYNPNDGVVDGISERIAKLAQGDRVVCYYDPDEPSQAILDREGVADPIWAFLIQAHLCLGLYLFLDGLKGLEKKKPRPYLRTTFWTALGITVATALVGFGLSILVGASVWAWLLMCSVPCLLYLGHRWLEARKPA